MSMKLTYVKLLFILGQSQGKKTGSDTEPRLCQLMRQPNRIVDRVVALIQGLQTYAAGVGVIPQLERKRRGSGNEVQNHPKQT